MTTSEFSNEFDILYNSIMNNAAPGVDEYEKSVFLTKAQLEILNNHFLPAGNKYNQGFDGNEKRQIDFSTLIDTFIYTIDKDIVYDIVTIDARSIICKFPTNALFILNESIRDSAMINNKQLNVLPINYQEYNRLMIKPYKYPLKNQAWRLLSNKHQASNTIHVELIIPKSFAAYSYIIRYVKFPNPIILVNLEGSGLTINNKSDVTECELDPILHSTILQRAVELAKAAYTGDINSTIEVGKRSE